MMRIISSLSCIFFLSGLIYGCSDQKSATTQTQAREIKKFTQETTLKGLVSDDKGRIKAGDIRALSAKNKIISTAEVQTNGQYLLKIPKDTALPLLLKVSFLDKKNTKIELTAAVVYNSMTKFNINPLSSKIAKKAKSLGGYTHLNMVVAAKSMVAMPDDNKSTQGFRGDPTKQYGGWH
jgi:hypothetical protein